MVGREEILKIETGNRDGILMAQTSLGYIGLISLKDVEKMKSPL